MRKSNLRGTKYRAYVRDRVGEYVRTICPAFTLKELAKFAKLTVTPSLRKRVSEMSKEGLLVKQKAFIGSRGSAILFYKQNTEKWGI